jgi:hypothetical protein
MCFSAGASFGASAVLSIIGVATIKKSQCSSQIPFASIPLIFAIQQFSEGFVWLSLSSPDFASIEKLSTYMFLIFAQIVWPLWVPIAITLMEKDVKRKKLLKVFIGIGLVVSSYFAHRLIMYGAHANIDGHHVAYKQVFPDSLARIADVLYGLATIAAIFLSKVKRMWTFGLAASVAYIVTAICYVNYILSVWCFFAAIMSILIYGIVTSVRHKVHI